VVLTGRIPIVYTFRNSSGAAHRFRGTVDRAVRRPAVACGHPANRPALAEDGITALAAEPTFAGLPRSGRTDIAGCIRQVRRGFLGETALGFTARDQQVLFGLLSGSLQEVA
jgi:hypothetical protein